MKPKYVLASQGKVNTVGLIGHWKFHEGSAFDYSLGGHGGTLKGTANYQYPGVDLDGDSDYVEIADSADFTPALTTFSISAWIYMDEATEFQIACKDNESTAREWGFATGSSDYLIFFVFDQSAIAWIGREYQSAMSAGAWTYVAGTYDGGTSNSGIKLYINGSQVDDANATNGTFVSVEDTAQAVHIGLRNDMYSDGKIDDVMIFNTELSAAQIKSIYEQTRGRYGV